MNLLPVIERELICEARNGTNYWLRLIGAAALMGLSALYMVRSPDSAQQFQGILLFSRMLDVLQLTIFVMVPIMAADCISREKREGTLGLLFLTPLRSREIVFGKCLIHGLRALTIIASAVPVLCLPMMMGGVALQSVITGLASIACALALALAASIHASVRNHEWPVAVGHGLFLSLLLSIPFWTCLNTRWLAPFHVQLIVTPFVLFGAYQAVLRSSVHLSRNWQRELATRRDPEWVQSIASSPFWRKVFKWNRAKALDRNPIMWLQECTWTRRLTKWAWFFLMLAAAPMGGCVVGLFMDYTTWLSLLTMVLAGGIAFTASGTFREEQTTGALEQLLVTPVTPLQFLHGRLLGIVFHFLPATLILGFFWLVPALFEKNQDPHVWMHCAFSFSTLFTIPLAAFWFGLQRIHAVTAWLVSLLVGYGVPVALVVVLMLFTGRGVVLPMVLFFSYQVLLAAQCYRRLVAVLNDREFLVPQ